MPVVINEFEAVAEEPAPRRVERPGENDQAGLHAPLEPAELVKPLHSLASQALRSWAH